MPLNQRLTPHDRHNLPDHLDAYVGLSNYLLSMLGIYVMCSGMAELAQLRPTLPNNLPIGGILGELPPEKPETLIQQASV